MKRCIALVALTMVLSATHAQNDTNQNVRTGWTFGALPSVSYDTDLGFQYGALTNIYYFGDGTTYPEYLHSFYVEAAYTTKQYGVFRMSYDSKYLIPDYRISLDLAYLPDAMSDFYGFNGYQSRIHSEYVDTESLEYLSRTYYKMKRNLLKLNASIDHNFTDNLSWCAGFGLYNYEIDRVNVEMLNRGRDNEEMLPDVTTLYDKYVSLGLISTKEKNGGFHPYIQGGISFDTRDREQNPRTGIYADAFVTATGAFGEMSEFNNVKFNAAWRQYIPLIRNRLTVAYRIGTQLLVAGKSTFYQNTYMNQLYYHRVLYEGLGGANSLRGILRNRILANGFAYGNVELRIQLFNFKIGKELFYIGLNPLMDVGMVVQPYESVEEVIAMANEPLDDFNTEYNTYAPHISGGCGLKATMNDNFVLSVDWATPLNEQDNYNTSNIYIKIGYMF